MADRFTYRQIGQGEDQLALAGGPADKYGNQYEAWWTIVRLMDVLNGSAHALHLEPAYEAGAGIEFSVREPGRTTYEQVKSGTSRGSWSLQRSADDLVLPALSHLRGGGTFRLVLAVPAPDLSRLANLARTSAVRPDEDLSTLQDAWSADRPEVLDILQRIEVEHLPERALRQICEARVDSQVVGPPGPVIRAMHGWLFESLHLDLDARAIRDSLRTDGFVLADLAGDGPTMDALQRTVGQFAQRVEVSSGSVIVDRAEASQVIASFEGGARCVILHGAPGSGKSHVARQVLAAHDDAPRAVIRMDTLDRQSITAKQLGEAVGLPGSPSALLGAVSSGQRSMLVIDQLDAVGAFSGRLTDSFEAVQEILDARFAWPRMRVLLVVRTVDLEKDPRIAAVAELPDCVKVPVGELTEAQSRQIAGPALQLDELRRTNPELTGSPLYLRLLSQAFGDIPAGSRLTPSVLFDALEHRAKRLLIDPALIADWTAILSEIAQRMSNSESLSLPNQQLTEFQPMLAQLISSGLLVQDSGRTAFFHERYMDHVFARSFTTASNDLVEFLKHSGQALFRRAQTRQVLQRIRDIDPRAFFRLCRRMLEDHEIRGHIKQIVVESLRETAPTPADWRQFETLMGQQDHVGSDVRSLLNLPQWLDAAKAAGDIPKLLESEFRIEVGTCIINNFAERPDLVRRLATPLLDTSEFDGAFRDLVLHTRTLPKSEFVEHLVSCGYLDDQSGEITKVAREATSALLYRFEPHDPALTWWLGVVLQRAILLAKDQHIADPFKGVLDRQHSAHEALISAARAQPHAFVDAVLPFIVATSQPTAESPYGRAAISRWDSILRSGHFEFDDSLLEAAAEAVGLIAREPEGFSQIIEQLGPCDSNVSKYIASRAYIALGDPEKSLRWLCDNPDVLGTYWDGRHNGIASDVIAETAHLASPEALERLLGLIHTEVSEFERSVHGWRFRGRDEWTLLLPIPPEVLPTHSRRRREELVRKFGDEAPRGAEITGGVVGSPVIEDAAKRMSDHAWLGAIERYDRERSRDGLDEFLKGGALELARVLEARATEEPERFLSFAHSLPQNAAPEYRSHLISGLAGKVPINDIATLAAKARELDGEEVSRAIGWALQKYTEPWPDPAIAIIEEIVTDSDPALGDTAFEPEPNYEAERLSSLGLNSNRGVAAHAIAAHLSAEGVDLTDKVTAVVETLCRDAVPAVRAASSRAVAAISRLDREVCVRLANEIFERGPEPLALQEGFVLFRWVCVNDDEFRGRRIAEALQSADPDVAKHIGAVWASLNFHDLLPPNVPHDFESLPSAVRAGVAWVWCSAAAPELDDVLTVLTDESADVRGEAHNQLRAMTAFTTPQLERLVEFTLDDEYFDELVMHLVDLLESYPGSLPANVVPFARRTLGLSNLSEITHISTASGLLLSDLFKVLRRFDRQNPALYGEEILDCIDAMIRTESARIWRLLNIDDRE